MVIQKKSFKRRNTLKRRNSLKRRTTLKRRKMYGRGPSPPPKEMDRSLYRTRVSTGNYGDEGDYSDSPFHMKQGPRGLKMGIWEWTEWPRAYNIYDVFGVEQGDVETLHAKIDKAHDVLDTVTHGIQNKAEPVIKIYKNVTGMILYQDPGEMKYLSKYTPETLREYLLRTKDNMNDPLQ